MPYLCIGELVGPVRSPLRSADSVPLAAAIVAAEHQPATLEFVSLDVRLNEAASRAGFSVQALKSWP